ncbi:MAG: M14 family zinc carboxypeptidase [Gemmatimonadota bacterium]|nr:M14 family zinc carboxypeptidase [Gemmatimonadota bacterium]
MPEPGRRRGPGRRRAPGRRRGRSEVAPPARRTAPPLPSPLEIGRSREGRPLHAYRFGTGPLRISLIAGCHADEPVGPRLLRSVAARLAALPAAASALRGREWWIVPHVNPDGAERNRSWQEAGADRYDPVAFLAGVQREPPGDDLEFGFPQGPDDPDARPEARALLAWWRKAGGPFHLHVSLHGMAFAAGPWFLVEPAWVDRTADLRARCAERVRALGYRLHDVERHGEKGFHRIAPGFCTRPDSESMRRHFLDRGDPETAARFRPSSMETIRSLGGDPLTLVSEMPLFLLPDVGEEIGPPDPAAEAWRRRLEGWRGALLAAPDAERSRVADEVRRDMDAAGLAPMAVRDQMAMQWTFIAAGVEAVESRAAAGLARPTGPA